jgi:hypothetical protein
VRSSAPAALETVSHAIEASQRIMHNLRPAILEQGLVAALQWMARRFEKRTGVACLFRTSRREHRRRTAARHRRAAGGLPHGAGGADQCQQARPGHARDDGPVAGGGVLSLEISDDGRGLASRRRPGQGAQLRHPRPARARLHRGRLGRPEQRMPAARR